MSQAFEACGTSDCKSACLLATAYQNSEYTSSTQKMKATEKTVTMSQIHREVEKGASTESGPGCKSSSTTRSESPLS